MVTKECLTCGAEVEVDTGHGHALGGQQLQTSATCPSCGTVHRLFESGQWTVAPDDKDPQDNPDGA